METANPNDAVRAAARLRTVMEHVQLENDHDLRRVMATFGHDAVYDVMPNAHFSGRAEVQTFYENFFKVSHDVRIGIKHTHVAEDAIVLEVEIAGTHSGADFVGLPSKGKAFSFPLCAIYTFGSDNKLAGERVYFDRDSVRQQLC